jgi:hypothetical protein
MKRRDLGMVMLGAAAGVAGCSPAMRNALVPDAVANEAVRPNETAMSNMYITGLKQDTGIMHIGILPAKPNFWTVKISDRDRVRVDEKRLKERGLLTIFAKAAGPVCQILLTGPNDEFFKLFVEVVL